MNHTEKKLIDLAKAQYGQPLDTFVQLMAKWVATSVEDLHKKQVKYKQDTLQLMASSIVPSTVAIQPEHAIIHVKPKAGCPIIDNRQHFACNANNGEPIYFSPAGNFQLFNGQIACLATSKALYQLESPLKKQLFLEASGEWTAPPFIWLGINFFEVLDEEELILCLNNEVDSNLLVLLPYCTWSMIDTSNIEVEQGLPDTSSYYKNFLEELDSPIVQKENEVQQFYQKNFLRLKSSNEKGFNDSNNKKKYPTELTSLYPEIKEKLTQPLMWVKVELPDDVTEKEILSLHYSLNCIPVIQRKLEHISILPDQIIDLQTTVVPKKENPDHFWGLEKICSNFSFYSSTTNPFQKHLNAGKYALKLMNSSEEQTKLEYQLLIQPQEEETEEILIYYWTTKGFLKNTVDLNNNLRPYYSDIFKPSGLFSLDDDSVCFVTELVNGRKPLMGKEKIKYLQSLVLSKDYFITKEDFRAACFSYLGRYVHQVDIQNSAASFLGPNRGIVKILNIKISPSNEGLKHLNRLETLTHSLQLYLNSKSGIQYPITVSLNSK